MTDTNETITVEDLAGLEALPIGTTFNPRRIDLVMLRTEDGVGFPTESTFEYTTKFIAAEYLPAVITNPEMLGGFAGIGDRVRIEATDPDSWGADYTGRFGILRQINPGVPETVPFRVELEEPDNGNKTAWCTSVKPAPQPFKIGDTVRVVREYHSGTGGLDGDVGTLVNFRDDEMFPYRVDFGDDYLDVVHEIELYVEPPTPEVALEYPLVNDGEGFDALPFGTILVPLDEGLTAVQNHGPETGWRCYQPGSYDLTKQTRETVAAHGALVVYQP